MLKGAIPVGNSPDQLASSPNHASTGQASIWTANAGDGTITRIDENSGRVLGTFRYARHSNPAAPIVFWQGALWVGDSGAGTVQELNPSTGKAMGTPIAVGGQPYEMTLAPPPTDTKPGNLWISNYNDTITRVSAGAGSSQPAVFHGLGSGPKRMAPSKTRLWVLNLDDATVTTVNPDTGQMLGHPHHVGGSPAAITYNKWGDLWIADGKRDTVTRFSPVSWKEIGSPIPVGSRPVRLLSHGCCVWVVNFGDGTVTQIDARTGQTFPKITVGGYPSALTFAGGFWWVGLWSQPTIEFHGPPGGVKRLPGP
jgi:DNA-binding beta-propeller fold protein YncE